MHTCGVKIIIVVSLYRLTTLSPGTAPYVFHSISAHKEQRLHLLCACIFFPLMLLYFKKNGRGLWKGKNLLLRLWFKRLIFCRVCQKRKSNKAAVLQLINGRLYQPSPALLKIKQPHLLCQKLIWYKLKAFRHPKWGSGRGYTHTAAGTVLPPESLIISLSSEQPSCILSKGTLPCPPT